MATSSCVAHVLEILFRYSDPEHPLKQKEILERLQREYGENVGPKTVHGVLCGLHDALDFVSCSEEKTRVRRGAAVSGETEETVLTDFYIEPVFSRAELRFLVDSIAYSEHVPGKYRSEIVGKLTKLGGAGFHPRRQLVSQEGVSNPEMLLTLELLDEAIELGRKVETFYLEFTPEKELVRARHGMARTAGTC